MPQLLLRASRTVNRHVVEGLHARGHSDLRPSVTTLLSNIEFATSTVTEGGGAGWDVADLCFEPSILSPSFRPEPPVGATEWPPTTRQCLLSIGEFVVSLGPPRSNSILHKLLILLARPA
jgi:hypothetical protein